MYIILYVSSIVWLFPIIRQYKGNFFYFFLILGLLDPLNILDKKVLHLFHDSVFFAIASLLLFFSVQNNLTSLLKGWVINLLLSILYLSLMLILPKLEILIAAIHLLILYKFIKITVIQLHNTGKFNLFYFVLVFYELSLIINLIVHLVGTDMGLVIFYSTLSFQILVAIFFTVFREDSSLLKIHIKVND